MLPPQDFPEIADLSDTQVKELGHAVNRLIYKMPAGMEKWPPAYLDPKAFEPFGFKTHEPEMKRQDYALWIWHAKEYGVAIPRLKTYEVRPRGVPWPERKTAQAFDHWHAQEQARELFALPSTVDVVVEEKATRYTFEPVHALRTHGSQINDIIRETYQCPWYDIVQACRGMPTAVVSVPAADYSEEARQCVQLFGAQKIKSCALHWLLTDLVEQHLLPAGTYLIDLTQ